MKTVSERLHDLRKYMKKAGCDAYIMPSSDPHASEYAPAHYTAWEYFSGFSCENATLIVTMDTAALWVDGRFFGAADAALKDTGIASMHMDVKGVPKVNEWLCEHLKKGQTLGFTASNMCLGQYNALKKNMENKGIILKAALCDDMAWEDRPALPTSECFILDKIYAGLAIREKLAAFRETWNDEDAAIVTKLDSIAWLLNLRANDVDCTPYALAFCFVTKEDAVLFTDKSRVPEAVKDELAENSVILMEYGKFYSYLEKISRPMKILVDKATINASVYRILSENPSCQISEGKDAIQMLKAVKNETEIRSTKEAHLIDGAAMVRFEMEFERRLAAGEDLSEMDIDPILHKYRSADDTFIVESFPTIAAYGSNAAMMHYAPTSEKHAKLEKRGFLLIDSGATYLKGTTDITRTYVLGPLTDKEREMYTLTLKSHIDMAGAVWLDGMNGGQLDMIARQPFWKRQLNYRCGTGHSVSHVGAVHEGPHSLRPKNDVAFVPGMIITDEPGYYEEGLMGVRIENELLCVDAGESEYGHFLKFEPITFVPIDTRAIIPEMLDTEEIAWLNRYHAQVVEKLSPYLNEEEMAWLKEKCKAI